MPGQNITAKTARTVLELRIRERRLTFEEFVQYAETFAREHGECGTLSIRHLQRLVAGRRPDGTAPGPLRPATARLLEKIFCTSIEELLAEPKKEIIDTSGDNGAYGTTVDMRTHCDPPETVRALQVAIAIVMKESEVLIVRRRGQDGCGISWQFPAGMVKPGTSPEAVAIRETYEETNIHCTVVREIGSRVHPITNVMCHYFLCMHLAGDAENMDVVENVSVTWTDKNTLTRFIPADLIFAPVLKTLEIST